MWVYSRCRVIGDNMDDMNITSAQWHEDEDNVKTGVVTTIDGQEMFVPNDPNNRHYQAIQKWVVEGNTIAEAD